MIVTLQRWKIFNHKDLTLRPEVSTGLDLIRGVSAQMVLIGHALSFYGIYPVRNDANPFYMQNLGVLIFFILSGFLITLTTRRKAMDHSEYGFSNFFMDRFVRIFTAYLPAIIFVLLIDYLSILINPDGYGHYEAFNLKTFAGNILMLQDLPEVVKNAWSFIEITSWGSARPFWTIAVEWWFYLFFGWLFLFKRIKVNMLLKILVLLFLAIIPVCNFGGGRTNCLTFLWYAGFFLSYIYNSGFVLKQKKALVIFGTWLLILMFILLLRRYDFKVYNYQSGVVVAGIILLLMVYFQQSPGIFSNDLVKRYIKLAADFSFTLYLIHYTILNFLHEIVQFSLDNPFMGFLTSVIVCNMIAFIIAYFTEFKHKKVRAYILRKYKI